MSLVKTKYGFPKINSNYYNKIRGNITLNVANCLGLYQHNCNVHNKNFFDILFFEISVTNFYIDLVVPDICRPRIVIWGMR
jgi:hypothetical protein